MAEFPAIPLFTDAYLGDTTHLTTIEHGAYFLLLITMWRAKDQRLPDDDSLLARYTRTTRGQWGRLRPVIAPFFKVENGWWTQGRLTDEYNAVRQKSKRQSDKARARWLNNKDSIKAAAVPQQCQSDASLTHTHIDSVTNVTGDAAPVVDFKKIIFDQGLIWLSQKTGKPPNTLRPLVGRWCKQGDERVAAAIMRAQKESAVEPIAFIEATLRGKTDGVRKSKSRTGNFGEQDWYAGAEEFGFDAP